MISIKRKLRIIIFVFLVGLSLLFVFAMRPLFKNIKENANNLGWQRSILDVMEAQIQNVENFREDYPVYQTTLENLEASFINFEAPIEFIEFLEREAKRNNIEIKISPLSTIKRESIFESLDFDILVAGNFSDTARFLRGLEKSPWLFDIIEVRIERITAKSRWLKQFDYLEEGEALLSFYLKAFTEKK